MGTAHKVPSYPGTKLVYGTSHGSWVKPRHRASPNPGIPGLLVLAQTLLTFHQTSAMYTLLLLSLSLSPVRVSAKTHEAIFRFHASLRLRSYKVYTLHPVETKTNHNQKVPNTSSNISHLNFPHPLEANICRAKNAPESYPGLQAQARI